MFCMFCKKSLIDSWKQKQQRKITFPAAFLIVCYIFCQFMDGESELLQLLVCQPLTINMIQTSCEALRVYPLNSTDLYPENLLEPQCHHFRCIYEDFQSNRSIGWMPDVCRSWRKDTSPTFQKNKSPT